MIGKEILNYTIVSLVGKGGMGSVYLAEHKYIKQQKVAIKVINGNMINDFTRQKLAEEADRLARMNHPNIVHFINYHIDEAGSIYLIMEYADGYSLEDYIKNVSGLIVEEKICAYFEPLLDAFDYAHKHKIIHKDIKPSNIIITNEGIPKILDFGIAALLDEGGQETAKDVIMGTPSYMSPEQVKGENLDQRSDIYSLGVLLHQMLTGNPPYDTTTLTEHEIYKHVVEDNLPRMKTYYKYVSDKVQAIVDKATNKKKELRYQSCQDFKKALHNAIYPPKISKGVKVAIAAMAAIVVFGLFFVWDYNRVKISYYKDYVEQWGVPQGVGKLSENEMKHREASYRFEYSKRKLRRMSLVNCYGNVVEHHDSEHMERYSDMLLFYNDNDNISYVKILDKSGKILYKKSYNDKRNTVIFQYDDENSTEFVLAATTLELFKNPFAGGESKGKITRYLLTYDNNGYVQKQEYASFFNTKVGDADGIYARVYERDEKGRVIEERYLGHDGKPKGNKKGLGIRRHKYSEKDDWYETAYLTYDGQESTDGNGVPVVKIDVDEYGNRIKETYLNGDGVPVLRTDCNAAGFNYVRDEHGLCVEMSYFDVDGNLCYSSDGIAGVFQAYDENGYVSELTCFGDKKEKCISNAGWSFQEIKNDSVGNVLKVWFYDAQKKLVETSNGYAGIAMKYDNQGNQIEYITYGKDGKPFLQSDNTVGYVTEFNERGFVTKLTNFGENLKPCKDNNGIVTWKREYDKRGNVTKVSYFDEADKPILSSEKISGIKYTYDDNGNEIKRTFFNTKGEPCLVDNKFYKAEFKYDDNGNLIKERFYDLNNNLTLNGDGLAGNDYVRDERGNILENTPIGVDGKLKKGKLYSKQKFDKFDNEIEFAVFDNKGPALNQHNFHRYVCKYNSRNQLIEIAYYGKNGKLVCYGDDKYAIQKQEYNAKGQRISCSYFGTDEKPVVAKEGWHTSSYECDAQGRIIRQLFYGLDGKPTTPSVMVPEGVCKYDKWGNMIYLASCDGKGNLIPNPQTGWSIQKCEYDIKGNVLWISYFNEKEKPILCKDGYHKAVYTYTNSGKMETMSYFDTAGKAMLVNGYHKEIHKYDENDLCIEQKCVDTAGNPTNCFAGFSKVVFTYDKNQNYRDRKFYNAEGILFKHEQYVNGEWVKVKNWKKDVADFADELPTNLGDEAGNLVIQSAKVIGSSLVEIIIVTPKSKYDMTDSMINGYKEFLSMFTKYFKQELELPRTVTVKGVLKDSKGRILSSASK